MSKSILVIDTPKNCRECKFSEYQGIVCRAMGLNKAHNNADSKPDWCPLEEYQETMNDIGELLPCPFCGGEAKFETLENGASNYNVNFEFTIRCSKCNCSLPESYNLKLSLEDKGDINIKSEDIRKEALKAWNKRI